MDATAYLEHRSRLSQLGDHWHEKLHHGSGPWDGDRFLFLYHHALTDDIELRYELPGRPPELVFKIALADFDIDKLCRKLAQADNRKTSVQDKIDAADAANDKLIEDHAARALEQRDEAAKKLLWAIRKDTGNHIAPMTVPELPR